MSFPIPKTGHSHCSIVRASSPAGRHQESWLFYQSVHSFFVSLTTPTPAGSVSSSNWTNSTPPRIETAGSLTLTCTNQEPEAWGSKILCRCLKRAQLEECQEVETLIINIREYSKNVPSRIWKSHRKSSVGLILHENQSVKQSRLDCQFEGLSMRTLSTSPFQLSAPTPLCLGSYANLPLSYFCFYFFFNIMWENDFGGHSYCEYLHFWTLSE